MKTLAHKCSGCSKVALLSVCLLLSACQHTMQDQASSSQDEALESASWSSDAAYFEAEQQFLSQLNRWQVLSKVGVTSQNMREQANLEWQFHDQGNIVRLFGPLGFGAIKLSFDDFGVELEDGKGAIHRGASAEQLLTELTGWPLPVNALSNWLFGLPQPLLPFSYLLDTQGKMVKLRQRGWEIEYSGHRQVLGRSLAKKLVARKQFSPSEGGLVTVKLITKSWDW